MSLTPPSGGREGDLVLGNRRSYSDEEFTAIAQRHRTWGRWGPDDELGAANFISEESIRQAAGLVRRGAAFSLAIPLDRDGPQSGKTARVNPQHFMVRHGGDIALNPETAGRGMFSTDDVVYMPLQCATQWDAFCHIFYDGQTYDGRGPDSVDTTGARFNSITTIADKAVGRGVLLDFARHYGVDHLEPGHAIQDDEIAECAERQGVEITTGDFVLIRTGHLARRRAEGWADYVAGPAPGLGLSAADFLAPRQITAVASDTWGLEVVPFETDSVRHPVHVVLLVNAGIYIGEIWDFEALSADCATDGVYEFLLVAPPLTVTGSVGSPLNPIAIK